MKLSVPLRSAIDPRSYIRPQSIANGVLGQLAAIPRLLQRVRGCS